MRAFPLKLVKKRDNKNSSWISSGIKSHVRKWDFLSNLKHRMSLSKVAMICIKRYHSTYKQVISETKRRQWQTRSRINKPNQNDVAVN